MLLFQQFRYTGSFFRYKFLKKNQTAAEVDILLNPYGFMSHNYLFFFIESTLYLIRYMFTV